MVHRAWYVPRRADGGMTHVGVIDDVESILQTGVQAVNKVMREVVGAKCSNYEELWKLCDLLVLVLRSSLSEADLGAAVATIRRLYGTRKQTERLLAGERSKVRDMFQLPVDPRPVLNLSGLWTTQMLASAVCVIDYDSQVHGHEEERVRHLSVLRWAAMLHGLGRIDRHEYDPSRAEHYGKELLSGLVTENLWDEISAILRTEKTDEHQRIEWAIEFVTVYRSVRGQLTGVVMEELSWPKDRADDDDALAGMTTQDMDRVVRAFLGRQQSPVKSTDTPDTQAPSVVVADVSGIQPFIRNTDRLSQLKGASLLIDGFMKDHEVLLGRGLPSLYSVLIDMGLPLETVVASGGGNMVLVVGSRYEDEVCSAIRSAFSKITTRLRVVTGTGRLSLERPELFIDALNQTRETVTFAKNELLEVTPTPIGLGIEMRCDSCRTYAASKKFKMGDTEQYYCQDCEMLHRTGYDESFASTYRKNGGEEVTGLGWDTMSKYVLEFIAGEDPEALGRETDEEEPRADIALLKGDANLAGRFMSNLRSMSELVEKNILLTRVLDEAIRDSYQWLVDRFERYLQERGWKDWEESAEELSLRLELGALYAGGDDLLLLAPSAFAVPLALRIAHKFREGMGYALGFSVSVVAFDPKETIRPVLEAAEALLDHCKTVSRTSLEEAQVVVDYEILKALPGGPEEIASIHERWRSAHLSLRPLVLDGEQHLLFKHMLEDPKEPSEALVRYATEYYVAVRTKDTEPDADKEEPPVEAFWKAASEVIEQIADAWQLCDTSVTDDARHLAATYCIYMMNRAGIKKRDSEVYRAIGHLVLGDSERRVGVLDAAVLARILMGGR